MRYRGTARADPCLTLLLKNKDNSKIERSRADEYQNFVLSPELAQSGVGMNSYLIGTH